MPPHANDDDDERNDHEEEVEAGKEGNSPYYTSTKIIDPIRNDERYNA